MEESSLDSRVGYELSITAHLIQNTHNRSLQEHQLTRSQVKVLYLLRSFGIQTQSELQRQMHVQGSTMNGIIDSLSRKELIIKSESTIDRRRKLVELTPKGRELESAVIEATLQMERELTEGMSEAEIQHLLKIFRKMQQQLKGEE